MQRAAARIADANARFSDVTRRARKHFERHGRELFYDYDELCLVEECTFRAVPTMREGDQTRTLDEWLYAGSDDVFPALFPQFPGIVPALRERLREAHGEIFDRTWWRDVQSRLAAGKYFDVPPCPDAARLPQVREPQDDVR